MRLPPFPTDQSRFRTPEYRAWSRARRSAKRRGLPLTPVLGSFTSFLSSVGLRPTPHHRLRRVVLALGFRPGNVRWLTGMQWQSLRYLARSAEIHGETRTLLEWSQRLSDYLHERIDADSPGEVWERLSSGLRKPGGI